MKTIKIFLASSEELRPERLEMTDLINQLNKLLKCRKLEINLEKWEYLDSAMSTTRKQDDYNEVLKTCEFSQDLRLPHLSFPDQVHIHASPEPC